MVAPSPTNIAAKAQEYNCLRFTDIMVKIKAVRFEKIDKNISTVNSSNI